MEQENNKIESKEAVVVEKIYTKLKFIKSDRNGALIGFVSQNPVNGIICGVRQDSPFPKKIVIVDKELSNSILINVLYECTLIPMASTKNIINEEGEEEPFIPGYIAIEATPVQFNATVTTKYIRGRQYRVEVSFGNKIIYFDPFRGIKESVKSLPACRAVLERRCDIQDLLEIVAAFDAAATAITVQLKQDMYEIHNEKGGYDKAGRRNRS